MVQCLFCKYLGNQVLDFKIVFPPENWDLYANFEYKTISVGLLGLRYLTNKMEFLIRWFWSKLKWFNLELPHILKTIKIKTDQFSQYGLLGHLRAIRSQLWPVGGTWRKYCRFEATIRHYEYGLICFRTAFCFVNISAP